MREPTKPHDLGRDHELADTCLMPGTPSGSLGSHEQAGSEGDRFLKVRCGELVVQV